MENLTTKFYHNEYGFRYIIRTYEECFEYVLEVEDYKNIGKSYPLLRLCFANEKDLDQSVKNFVKMIKKAGFTRL